jgi:hypothetical protein
LAVVLSKTGSSEQGHEKSVYQGVDESFHIGLHDQKTAKSGFFVTLGNGNRRVAILLPCLLPARAEQTKKRDETYCSIYIKARRPESRNSTSFLTFRVDKREDGDVFRNRLTARPIQHKSMGGSAVRGGGDVDHGDTGKQGLC